MPVAYFQPCFITPCFINPCFINSRFITPCFINPCVINPVHVLQIQSSSCFITCQCHSVQVNLYAKTKSTNIAFPAL